MNRIQTYQIYPTIPHSISFLEVLSRNLWWCWKPDAIELFRRIDPRLWESSGRNPVVLFANDIAGVQGLIRDKILPLDANLQSGRQAGRQAGRKTDRQTDRPDRQAGRQTDRQTAVSRRKSC